MYPKFIDVHLADDDCLVSINIDNIIGISNTDNHGAGYVIKTSERGGWYVRESYDELKQLIEDAGCLIHKADPRLDTNHPLTMDDMKEIIGEPVWNSNMGEWGLVLQINMDESAVRILDAEEHWFWYDADDLKKYPMYRMKFT